MRWTREKALAYRAKIERAAESQTDEDALQSVELFPKWADRLPSESHPQGIEVKVGERLQDGGKLYRVLQQHYPQSDWRPSVTPALFVEVPKPGEIRDITDPIPAEYPFMKGELGRWKGHIYESNIDNNVWTPDAYPAGWTIKD